MHCKPSKATQPPLPQLSLTPSPKQNQQLNLPLVQVLEHLAKWHRN
jgi:hypothetical protein